MSFVFSHIILYTQKTAIVSIEVATIISKSQKAFLLFVYIKLFMKESRTTVSTTPSPL